MTDTPSTDTRFLERPDGSTIAYDVRGAAGPWVVLVHGFAYPRLDFADLADLVAARGCRVVTLDNRGVGETTTDLDRFFTLEEMGADVLAVTAAVGATDVTLFGLSMGGGIALHALGQDAAANAPLIARAVIAAPNAGERLVFPHAMGSQAFDEIMARTRPVMESLVQGVVPEGFDPGVVVERIRAVLAARTLEERPEVVEQVLAALTARPIAPVAWLRQVHAGARQQWTFEVPDLDLPLLLLHGAEDGFVNLINSERLSERYAAPLQVLDDAGHAIHRDRPERVAELIATFALDGTVAP